MKNELNKVLEFLRDLRVESLFKGHERRKESIAIITNVLNETLKAEDVVEQILWKKGMLENETLGYIHGNLMFIIERKGKRIVTYTLKTYPFHNDVFTRANNYKKLSTVPEEQLPALKEYAQKVFNSYVKLFLKKNVS